MQIFTFLNLLKRFLTCQAEGVGCKKLRYSHLKLQTKPVKSTFYVTNVKYKTVFKCLVKALKYSTLDLNPELCNYPLKKNK